VAWQFDGRQLRHASPRKGTAILAGLIGNGAASIVGPVRNREESREPQGSGPNIFGFFDEAVAASRSGERGGQSGLLKTRSRWTPIHTNFFLRRALAQSRRRVRRGRRGARSAKRSRAHAGAGFPLSGFTWRKVLPRLLAQQVTLLTCPISPGMGDNRKWAIRTRVLVERTAQDAGRTASPTTGRAAEVRRARTGHRRPPFARYLALAIARRQARAESTRSAESRRPLDSAVQAFALLPGFPWRVSAC